MSVIAGLSRWGDTVSLHAGWESVKRWSSVTSGIGLGTREVGRVFVVTGAAVLHVIARAGRGRTTPGEDGAERGQLIRGDVEPFRVRGRDVGAKLHPVEVRRVKL